MIKQRVQEKGIGDDQRCVHRREPRQREPPAAHRDSLRASTVSPALIILISCNTPVSSLALKAAESFRKAVRITQGKWSWHRAANELVQSRMPTRVSALTLGVHSAVNQHNIHSNAEAGLDIPPLHAGKCGECDSSRQPPAEHDLGNSPLDKSQPGAAPSLDHLQLILWRGFMRRVSALLLFTAPGHEQDGSRLFHVPQPDPAWKTHSSTNTAPASSTARPSTDTFHPQSETLSFDPPKGHQSYRMTPGIPGPSPGPQNHSRFLQRLLPERDPSQPL